MLLALTMLASLCACSKTKNPKQSTPDVSGGVTETAQTGENADPDAQEHTSDVTLTFWAVSKWAGIEGTEADGQYGDWENYMARQFMDKYPNVTIQVEVYDTNNGPTTMASVIAADETPDVVHDAAARLMNYSNSGFLVPVIVQFRLQNSETEV